MMIDDGMGNASLHKQITISALYLKQNPKYTRTSNVPTFMQCHLIINKFSFFGLDTFVNLSDVS
jgi:hypothetical protein